jgi:hypothetical protein
MGKHFKPLNKRIHYKKVCRSCGELYSDDFAETEICPKCHEKYKGKKPIPYKCTCGQIFMGQIAFRAHRSEMKKAGTPCPPYKRHETMTNCPYCGKELSASMDKRWGKETLFTHYKTCNEREIALAKYGSYKKTPMAIQHKQESMQSIEYIIKMLTSPKREDPGVSETAMNTALGGIAGQNTLQQNIFLYSVFEKYNRHYDLKGCLYRASSIQNVILELQLVFNFDNQLKDYFRETFEKEKWLIIDLNWSDFILNPEESEKKVIQAIIDQENKLGVSFKMGNC